MLIVEIVQCLFWDIYRERVGDYKTKFPSNWEILQFNLQGILLNTNKIKFEQNKKKGN